MDHINTLMAYVGPENPVVAEMTKVVEARHLEYTTNRQTVEPSSVDMTTDGPEKESPMEVAEPYAEEL